jgi:hypothetical protein
MNDQLFYYTRDGKQLATVSINVALIRRDPGTTIYLKDGKNKIPVNDSN